MLPRTPRNLWVALLVMFAGCALRALCETSAGAAPAADAGNASQTDGQPGQSDRSDQSLGVWRYHFGDDPDGKLGWADPNFDDSAWPVAGHGRWPIPAFYSSGSIWVRVRIAVPAGVTGPMAIRDTQTLGASDQGLDVADEVFVNGVLVGSRGGLPPHIELKVYGRDSVFDLPPGLTVPGTNAVVAFRAWYPPVSRSPGNIDCEVFAIDQSGVLHLAAQSDRLTAQLAGGPDLALNLLIGVMALGLLILWRFT